MSKEVKKSKDTKVKSNKEKKKKPSKYYAIKVGKGVTDKIVRSWAECKEYTDGCKSIFKSFLTEEEAKFYLESITDVAKTLEINTKAMNKNKEIKNTTRALSGIRIPKELYEDFQKKCNEFTTPEEVIIKGLIEEWLLS